MSVGLLFQRPLPCWASLVAQLVKNQPAMQETLVQSLRWEDSLEKGRLYTPVFLGFPGSSAGKESTCNVGGLGSIPGLGRFPGEGEGYPLQCSDLESSMDCSPWGRKESDTTERLSLSGFPSGAVAECTCQCRRRKGRWFDPWIGKIPWGRKWQPVPVFFPG